MSKEDKLAASHSTPSESAARRFGFRSYVSFIFEYFKSNLSMEMEYRASFIGRVAGMVMNDTMWLSYWLLYFARFPVVRGWGRNDVITLWAVNALGFGLCYCFFGNVARLSSLIVRGDLDFYLVYPRHVLTHMASSRVDATAIGDIVFGVSAFFALVRPNLVQAGLFLVSGILVACLFFGFSVIVHCLSFFIGNSERFSEQASFSLIHFSTYPSGIFGGATRVVLFKLIPAGFINSIPVSVIRDFNPLFFGAFAAAAVSFVFAADRIFKIGLKRYESGNLMQVRM